MPFKASNVDELKNFISNKNFDFENEKLNE